LQKVKQWLWGVYISYDKKTGEQMNIEDSCHRFFAAEREFVRGTARVVLLAESNGNKGWVSHFASQTHPKTDRSFRQKS